MPAVQAPASGKRPALFLDRDGVINVERGYVHRVQDFEFLPGIFDLVAHFVRERAWPAVVVSNQSGIGRGYYSEADYGELTDWMCARFAAAGAPLARVYYCPYHPEHGLGAYKADHSWRKPKPGMLLQAAADLALDLSRSILIGDKASDVAAGRAAGLAACFTIGPTPPAPATRHFSDLAEALAFLRSFEPAAP